MELRAVWSMDFPRPCLPLTRPVDNDFICKSAEDLFAAFCKGCSNSAAACTHAYFSALILRSTGQLNINV